MNAPSQRPADDPCGRPFPVVPGVEVRHSFVTARGIRFHVAQAGPDAAPPVLLLHGWPQHWYVWRKVLPLLSGEARCVMVDLRGLGWTEAPAGGYEKQTLADDVCAVLDALQLGPAVVVGHDWGGWIGFLLALGEPQRVERLLALNIIPPWPPRAARSPRPSDALALARLVYQPLLAAPWIGETLLRRTPLVSMMLRADNVHRDTFTRGDAEQFAAALRERPRARASSLYYRDWLMRELVPFVRGRFSPGELTVPAHLLYGTADAALGPEPPQAEGLLTVEPVADSGHFIAEERADLVAERVGEMLAVQMPAGGDAL